MLVQHLRYALRQLCESPGFAFAVLLPVASAASIEPMQAFRTK